MCAHCKKHYPQKEVSVDHIEPVGTLKSFDDLPAFVERLFVGEDKLQVLCSYGPGSCHHTKTQQENEERRNGGT